MGNRNGLLCNPAWRGRVSYDRRICCRQGTTAMAFEMPDLIARLGAAAAIGGLVGINRDLAGKPIGGRTLALVALGATIATMAVIELPTISEHPDALSRVVQGVVQGIMAGISFIGAGVILRNKKRRTVEGLTTAA